jgi:enamine deaminase RidA (YjgF/YER057c/UK114 family)
MLATGDSGLHFNFLLFPFSVSSVSSVADKVCFFEEGRRMAKKFINPPGLKPLGMYTQATVVQGGSIAFISGQVSVDGQGKVVGPGDIGAQAVQVFKNLELALDGIGATFEDVVKFTIFIVGLTQEKRKAVMEVRSRYISHKNPPAATMIGVDKLVESDLLLEIEAVVAIN